jgi:multisubunit Na+/H+ antiporter MnhG subunit
MRRPSALTSLAAFLVLVAAVGFRRLATRRQRPDAGTHTLGVVLALSGALGAQAQWERGGNFGLGFVVVLLFGPLGLLVANYSGGRECPACRSGGLHRDATRCARCGATRRRRLTRG